MSNLKIRPYKKSDIQKLADLYVLAWEYFIQEADRERITELLHDYLDMDYKYILIALQEQEMVALAEVTIADSFRYAGYEARLELLYVKNTVEDYYHVHSSLMDAIFLKLREMEIEYLRTDTTLENAEVLFI